jgi:hypothetical protein
MGDQGQGIGPDHDPARGPEAFGGGAFKALQKRGDFFYQPHLDPPVPGKDNNIRIHGSIFIHDGEKERGLL